MVLWCKVCKNAHPDDLWKTYFTSSKQVAITRLKHGEPDIIEIRRTFNDRATALDWEHRVLKKLGVIKRSDYLNKTDNKAIALNQEEYNEIGRKAGLKLKGRKQSEEHRKNLALSRKSRGPIKVSDETRRKIGENSRNISINGRKARSEKMSQKIWINNGKVNRRANNIIDGWVAGRINLKHSPLSVEKRVIYRLKKCEKTHLVFQGIEYLSIRHAEEVTGVSRYLIQKALNALT